MPDSVSKERRSEIMSHIASKDTSIELVVRKKLHALGFRYRVNYSEILGKPDIVFIKKKIAIFLHGCYWHGHETGCRYSHTSKSNIEYWGEKIQNNKKRDEKNIEFLKKSGWHVLVIWECQVKEDFENTISIILDFISSIS